MWKSASAIRERPADVRCTPNDHYNSIIYEHRVVAQAAAAAAPQAAAPHWAHQIRNDLHDLPVLHSVNDIENLNGQDLVAYLTGYGVVPPVDGNSDLLAA
ncbi:hypothetical protein M378DRAFT_12625 [Amanita muscaria Koide BX008]|uniref:Mug135-like C-terminal domain-containing protein n=1 Tax=Amanita muscaria (strain Koide BX008) TaxID=946122 RepID=A0A0C2WM88_AMAMK|nr:hypothetical protein M378DRAFT_12625 [Amanita muscaria Koide BX008]